MNKPSDSELLDAVERAGWLLEQRAYRILDAANCHPRASWAFEDLDDRSKSRELDVFGFRQLLRDDKRRLTVAAKFLVECKQSKTPFAAIGQHLPPWQAGAAIKRHGLSIREFPFSRGEGSYSMVPSWRALRLVDIDRRFGDDGFRASQVTKLEQRSKTWEADNAGIFNGLVLPLAKAVTHAHRGIREQRVSTAGISRDPHSWIHYDITFPVVVTSAPLLVVDATSEVPTVSECKWFSARRELDSLNLKGLFEIDFVSIDGFDEYVSSRLSYVSAIADQVRANPSLYTAEAWESPDYDSLAP